MRTTRVTPKPPTLAARRKKLRDQHPDLSELVTKRVLAFAEAEAAANVRARQRIIAARKGREPQPGDAWLRNNLGIPETADDWVAYANFIRAHSWQSSYDVKYGQGAFAGFNFSTRLSETVFLIHKKVCPFPCDQHPVLPDELLHLFVGMFDGAKRKEAEEIAAHGTYLVPGVLADEAIKRWPKEGDEHGITLREALTRLTEAGALSG